MRQLPATNNPTPPSFSEPLPIVKLSSFEPFHQTLSTESMNCKWLLLFLLLVLHASSSIVQATDHIVGDSLWTIPPSNKFYSNWSSNKSFSVGDNLVFKFETGFYNVLQVSRREYEDCKAENYFRAYFVGPATVSLTGEGMYYFITNFGNYCLLGQKVFVSVQRRSPV
ncbi:hypothetical protein J5N97_010878 [Dioscorea zingiberensis]|uniref:Phytocyanin domain-containing protein n=1 Tax=Dioscorea zingiberensis TaxID=325984 RepID=A0A9D5HN26_9LILI|nr:hypothetical protein J5N97_010878 [Dioscorea zingiberensis]